MSESELVAYRNRNTNTFHVLDRESADLESRPNFERADLSTVPESAIRAARRAITEREAVERAASIRAQRVEVRNDASTAAAAAGAESLEQPPVFAAATHTQPESHQDGEGVLARNATPDTQREALLDRAEHERLNPPAKGVLSRADLTAPQVRAVTPTEDAMEQANEDGKPATDAERDARGNTDPTSDEPSAGGATPTDEGSDVAPADQADDPSKVDQAADRTGDMPPAPTGTPSESTADTDPPGPGDNTPGAVVDERPARKAAPRTRR